MSPTEITAAASAYLAGFDSPDPIAAIAARGTSQEDDYWLEETYGDHWPAVALAVQEECHHRCQESESPRDHICPPGCRECHVTRGPCGCSIVEAKVTAAKARNDRRELLRRCRLANADPDDFPEWGEGGYTSDGELVRWRHPRHRVTGEYIYPDGVIGPCFIIPIDV